MNSKKKTAEYSIIRWKIQKLGLSLFLSLTKLVFYYKATPEIIQPDFLSG